MKRIFSLIVVAILCIAVFLTGCAGKPSTDSKKPDESKTPSQQEPKDSGNDKGTDSGKEEDGVVTYPLNIKQDEPIKYWKPISGDLLRKEGVSSDNGTGWAEGLQERTGLKIEFINPAAGQEGEQFNLLLASGDLPDIIEYPWLNAYPAGPDDAIKKGLVADLTDVMEKWAPDFIKYIRSHGDLDKKFKTDEGKYWGFGFIREDPKLCIWRGPVIRKDLLDKAGLPVPETIDDWNTTLKAFKDMGIEYPFSQDRLGNLINEGAFCAWGAMPGIYQVNGKVVYGPIEEGFKDVLLLLRGWYADGLLDPNFLTNDGKTLNTLVTSGKVGATIGNTGGGIGAWTPPLKENIPDAQLVAAPYPVLNKGDRPQFGQKEQDFYQNYIVATISPKSKYFEECVKLLNYGYTEEGDLFMNYGIEGVTYDMINGYPTMRPEIVNAPDNKAEWSYYARSPYSGIMIQRVPYLEQLLVLQEQKDALTIWDNDRDKYILPPITQTVDEGSEFSRIINEINTYYDEFTSKYIMGELPEDAYEKEFIPTIKSLNIDRALELRQAALDRYNSR